jgi:hypothetical protein
MARRAALFFPLLFVENFVPKTLLSSESRLHIAPSTPSFPSAFLPHISLDRSMAAAAYLKPIEFKKYSLYLPYSIRNLH